jgi:hypothetical protein
VIALSCEGTLTRTYGANQPADPQPFQKTSVVEIMSFHVPEAEYCVFGYEPDYESLPWQESFIAAKQRDDSALFSTCL